MKVQIKSEIHVEGKTFEEAFEEVFEDSDFAVASVSAMREVFLDAVCSKICV